MVVSTQILNSCLTEGKGDERRKTDTRVEIFQNKVVLFERNLQRFNKMLEQWSEMTGKSLTKEFHKSLLTIEII